MLRQAVAHLAGCTGRRLAGVQGHTAMTEVLAEQLSELSSFVPTPLLRVKPSMVRFAAAVATTIGDVPKELLPPCRLYTSHPANTAAETGVASRKDADAASTSKVNLLFRVAGN
jgi:hypothetical protein